MLVASAAHRYVALHRCWHGGWVIWPWVCACDCMQMLLLWGFYLLCLIWWMLAMAGEKLSALLQFSHSYVGVTGTVTPSNLFLWLRYCVVPLFQCLRFPLFLGGVIYCVVSLYECLRFCLFFFAFWRGQSNPTHEQSAARNCSNLEKLYRARDHLRHFKTWQSLRRNECVRQYNYAWMIKVTRNIFKIKKIWNISAPEFPYLHGQGCHGCHTPMTTNYTCRLLPTWNWHHRTPVAGIVFIVISIIDNVAALP